MQVEKERIESAKERLLKEFYDTYRRPLKTPKTVTQLETKLENEFFYWHVDRALAQMAESRILNRTDYKTKYAGISAFYYPKEVEPSSALKHIRSIAKLMDKYSNPIVIHAIGKHLEGLVRYELRVQGFNIIGENTREYKGKTWTQTMHDLDFVVEYRSAHLALGVEVKNTLSVMPRDEIDVKIKMCNFLGIKPLFAVRWVKPHVEEIKSRGGFAWMFKTQIFPLGHEDLVRQIFKRMGLPVTVRTDLPPKTIPPFQRKIKEWLDEARAPHS